MIPRRTPPGRSGSRPTDHAPPQPRSPPWRALGGFDQFLATVSDPLTFMTSLVKMLCTLPGINGAWIGRPNDDELLIPEAIYAPSLPVLQEPSRMIDLRRAVNLQSPAGRAWHHQRPEFCYDVQRDLTLRPWRRDFEKYGLRSCVSLPLTGPNGGHRLLMMYSSVPGFFHENWTVGELTEFGAIIGTTIENRVRLHALQRSKRLLDTLLIGSETLLDADNADGALRMICQRLTETGLFTAVAIGDADERGMFAYRIAAGLDADGVRRLRQSITDDSDQQLLGVRAWKSGTIQTANGYASLLKLRKWRSIAARGGWQSAAAVPVRNGARIHAILFVVSSDTAVMDLETQRLVEQIARTIGRTLDDLEVKSTLRAERETQSHIARHDALTLLPNRRAFEEALPAAISAAPCAGNVIGIGMLDLDGFKPINDRFGHAAGDHVLRCLAKRLRGTLRDHDFIARLGGDEFALIIHDLPNNTAIEQFCKRLHSAIIAPITLETGEMIIMTASLGLTLHPADPSAADTLVRHADIALYSAKSAKATRRKFWTLYAGLSDPATTPSHHSHLIAANQITIHYQPMITIHNNAPVAIIALPRLRDGRKLLHPAGFLDALPLDDRERLFETGLREGMACLRRLDQAGQTLNLAVDLDAEVISKSSVTPLLAAAISESGIAPARVIMEIHNGHIFDDARIARHHLNALRATGVKIALDNLGIGFSKDRGVQRLPIDFINVDKSFLAEIYTEPNDIMLLADLLSSSNILSILVGVSGVETPDMLEALRIIGAPLAQGGMIARPLSETALCAWLNQPRSKPVKGPPRTALGAFALHARWLRAMAFAPRDLSLRGYLNRAGPLSILPYLVENNFTGTELGQNYAALMDGIDQPDADIGHLQNLANTVRRQLASTIIARNAKPASTRRLARARRADMPTQT